MPILSRDYLLSLGQYLPSQRRYWAKGPISSHCEAFFRRGEDISQACVWEELQPGWPGCGQERGMKSSNKATRSTTWPPTRLGSPSPNPNGILNPTYKVSTMHGQTTKS